MRYAPGLLQYSLEFSRPRKAHIQYRLPGSLVSCSLRLRQRTFRFLLPAEYVLHIHAGFLHHFGFEVRVDVGRGLVIRVAQYFHGDQRFHACLEKQRRVIMPEIMRRQRRFQLLDDIVLTLGCFGHLAFLYAVGSLHQAQPDAFEATLRPRLANTYCCGNPRTLDSIARNSCGIGTYRLAAAVFSAPSCAVEPT